MNGAGRGEGGTGKEMKSVRQGGGGGGERLEPSSPWSLFRRRRLRTRIFSDRTAFFFPFLFRLRKAKHDGHFCLTASAQHTFHDTGTRPKAEVEAADVLDRPSRAAVRLLCNLFRLEELMSLAPFLPSRPVLKIFSPHPFKSDAKPAIAYNNSIIALVFVLQNLLCVCVCARACVCVCVCVRV